MRRSVRFLLWASRVFALGAVLAGLAMGLLWALTAGFVCFDSCTSPDFYFSNLAPGSIRVMTPCMAFEALALVTFLAYCVATRQPRRALVVIAVLLGIGLAGDVALNALLRQGEATFVGRYDILPEGPIVAWDRQWGLALMAVAVVWSGVLAYLQWGRGVEWNPTGPL